MNSIQRNKCNPYTAEPYLLKLCIIPFVNDILIGKNTYNYIQ
nr:MAG TPA: hypothetical protein [Crassvirales sp.]DAU16108.1 MAG TPA: hypothetical protein [Caudoviricetes sp.]